MTTADDDEEECAVGTGDSETWLPSTGVGAGPLVGLGALLLASGTLLAVLARRHAKRP
ncbi:hypothetical protein [Actinophytocola gossypii]|uniref:hypothetical protein n=1 Tax=Actinophytocola gossypii TaxID=2812003 RepID=UPI0021A758F3|nr:hypothetical protein [Actinophytocola gossypii]